MDYSFIWRNKISTNSPLSREDGNKPNEAHPRKSGTGKIAGELNRHPDGKLISTVRKLHLVEILIHPALGQQGIMAAVFHNPAVLNNDNPVGVSNG